MERFSIGWEYMGIYTFDKLIPFTEEELREVQTEALVDCLVSSMFVCRDKEKYLHKNSVSVLCDLLVPGVLKCKSRVSRLTADDIRKLFMERAIKIKVFLKGCRVRL